MTPCFLNVDLEIMSKTSLDSLARDMGRRVIVLHCGPFARRHLLVLESSRQHKKPDAAIAALCSAIEHLAPAARRIWKGARKDFDVGYELRSSERSSRFTLRPGTLERVARLGATLTVTYYREEDAGNAPPKRRPARQP
jgi:sugar phosphate isomerase/epimerase